MPGHLPRCSSRWSVVIGLASWGCGMVGLDVPHGLGDDAPGSLGGAGLGDGDGDGDQGESGGTSSSGGKSPSGGNDPTGGVPNSGGSTSTGGEGDTGGQTATGGMPIGSGGEEGTGGHVSTGGLPGSGGDTGTGGLLGTGGLSGIGGLLGAGGTEALEVLYSEDLESGQLPSGPGGVDSNHAQLSTSIVYEGNYALDVQQIGASLGRSGLKGDFSPQVLGANIHTRAWIYIPAGSLNGRLDILRLSAENESLDFGVNYEGRLSVFFNGPGSTSSSADGYLRYDEWICFETHTLIDDVAGSVQLSLDGQIVLTVSPFDTSPPGGFSSFSFGLLAAFNNQTYGKVYFDDVVVSTGPVGCD